MSESVTNPMYGAGPFGPVKNLRHLKAHICLQCTVKAYRGYVQCTVVCYSPGIQSVCTTVYLCSFFLYFIRKKDYMAHTTDKFILSALKGII